MTEEKRPNILFIMTDQQRWDALGCTGGWVSTPNLDRIASEGILFPNCVTTTPVCIPARVTMATGLYPHNTGVWKNCHYTLSAESRTWMQAIRETGYRTSLFGKTHLHPHSGDLREREGLIHAYGLDDVNEIGGPRASARVLSHMTAEWEERGLWEAYRKDYAERFANKPNVVRPSALPLDEYADTYVGQRAKEYLRNYQHDEPWFCWVSFGGPHEPWDTPEPYASMYSPKKMPPPAPRPEWNRLRPHGVLDRRLAEEPMCKPEDVPRMRADYAGNVSLIDDQIGEILEAIEERGELDNTVIAFTSDHGELNGDFGLIYKETFLDGCVRVPLIVRTPQTLRSPIAGSCCNSPAEWSDVGPTLVELAGAELTYRQFAKSMAPSLVDPAVHYRDSALTEIHGEVMLMTERWKIAVNADGEVCLLVDRSNDPEEQYNLAGAPETATMEAQLKDLLFSRIMQSQIRLDA